MFYILIVSAQDTIWMSCYFFQ